TRPRRPAVLARWRTVCLVNTWSACPGVVRITLSAALTRRPGNGRMSVFEGVPDAPAMLRVRQNSGLRPYDFSRPQRSLPPVQSQPSVRADPGKRLGQARPRLHALSALRQGSESGLGGSVAASREGDRLDLHPDVLGKTRRLDRGARRPGFPEVLAVDL